MDRIGNIPVGCRVEEARWDDTKYERRTVVTRNSVKGAAIGEPHTIIWDYLASALGQSHIPKYPDLPGLDTFNGSLCTRHAGK